MALMSTIRYDQETFCMTLVRLGVAAEAFSAPEIVTFPMRLLESQKGAEDLSALSAK